MGANNTTQITKMVNETLQASMTNVINQNSFRLSVLVGNTQVNNIEVTNSIIRRCSIEQINKNSTNVEIVTKISSESINDLQTAIQNEVDNKIKQISETVNGFLGGLGTFNSQNNTIDIVNRATQIVQKDIQNLNLTDIIAENTNFQTNTLKITNTELDCEGGKIVQLNEIQANIVLKIVAENSVQNIIKDSVINRIVNDVDQRAKIENKGLDSLLSGFFLVIVAIVIGVVVVFSYGTKAIAGGVSGAAKGIGKVGSVLLGLLPLIGAGLLAWLSAAYTWNFYPYETRIEYWSCIKDADGMVTGECRQVASSEEGKFGSKSQCEKAVAEGTAPCGQYWGCIRSKGQYGDIYTGGCKQYTNATLGPYKSKDECDKLASTVCKNNYVCAIDDKGLYIEPNICVPVLSEYSSSKLVSDKSKTEVECKNGMAENCRNYWGIVKRGGECKCVAFRTNKQNKIGGADKEDSVFYDDVITLEDCKARLSDGCEKLNSQ